MNAHVPADYVFGAENGKCIRLVKPPAVANPPVIVFIRFFDDPVTSANGQIDILQDNVPDFSVVVSLNQSGACGIATHIADGDIADVGPVSIFLRQEGVMFHDAERNQSGPYKDITDLDIPNHQTSILAVTVMAVDRDAERAVYDAEIAERAFADGSGTYAETDRRLIRPQNAVGNCDLSGFRRGIQQVFPVSPDSDAVVGGVYVAA